MTTSPCLKLKELIRITPVFGSSSYRISPSRLVPKFFFKIFNPRLQFYDLQNYRLA